MTQQLQSLIDQAWEDHANLSPKSAPADIREAVANAIGQLDRGTLRVTKKQDGEWIVNQWIKKAVLLSFRLEDNAPMAAGGFTQFHDKVPSKFANYTAEDFAVGGFRVVPPAVTRRGSFIAKNAVLVPSYVSIGVYVDEDMMVDTWATVGSCTQIGKNVHLSGGVGIGDVPEPLQANPAIIEDNCFIGARSEVVEGVIVEENPVISMGVYLDQSTKIYDRETDEVSYGRIPAGLVVMAGNLPPKDGSHSLHCTVTVKKVDAKTRAEAGLNELLRGDRALAQGIPASLADMLTTSNAAMSKRNTAGTRFGKLRQRIMGPDPDTISTVLSLLPTILEQANKTIDKFKNRKKTSTEPSRVEGAAPDPNTRIAKLEATILQWAGSVKLLAEQHAITIDALRDEAAWLERHLRHMTWLVSVGFAMAVAALPSALQAFRHQLRIPP